MPTRKPGVAAHLAAPAMLFCCSLAAATVALAGLPPEPPGAGTGVAAAEQQRSEPDTKRTHPDQPTAAQIAPGQAGQTGPEQVANQSDPEQPGPDPSGAEQSGQDQPDTEQQGTEQQDAEQTGPEHVANQSDPQQSDPQQSGPEQATLATHQYLEVVSQLESTGGVYQPDLSETLVGLGMTYLEQGSYPEAEAAFRRALHTSRVNDGLYNPYQLPILDRLIEVNTVTGDWEELEQNYHYLWWVSRRNFGDSDPRLLPVIDRIGKWHLHAFEAAADGMPFAHLQSADALYHQALGIIEARYGPGDPRMINALYAIALVNYRLATLVSDASQTDQMRIAARNSPFYTETQQLLERTRVRSDLLLAGYVRGKNAMERVVAIRAAHAQSSPEEHALALVHLADWYLLFSKLNSSQETYSQAYALLGDRGLPSEEIDKLFAHPRSLPAFYLPAYDPGEGQDQDHGYDREPDWEQDRGREQEQEQDLERDHGLEHGLEHAGDSAAGQGQDYEQDQRERQDVEALALEEPGPEPAADPYVLLSFDVSGTGVPRNITVLESSPPDDVAFQRKAKRSVAASRFRPRMIGGVPVEATDIKLRFIQPREPATEE